MVEAYITGISPRSEKLIAATRGFDRGRVSEAQVEEALSEDLDALVRLQLEAGFHYLSDGLLNWQDLLRPFVEAWEGLSPGALTRWFDNNTFYRQPVIDSEIVPHPLDGRYFRLGPSPKGTRLKAVLPGPYTFASLSDNQHYHAPAEAILDISSGLSDLCAQLAAQGCDHFQFSEPSLVVEPPTADLWEALRDAYAAIRSSVDGELSVHLYFAPVGPLGSQVLELPVDVIGIDMYEEDLKVLADVDFDKSLACGCLDSRNSLMETPEEIIDMASRYRDSMEPKDLILCPNADLAFLPSVVAEQKIRALGMARQKLEEAA